MVHYNINEQFMLRCLELARNGEGRTAPNPLVGAVVVYNGQIIGEGYHPYYGAPHAEVMAINSVTDKSLLPKSTIYVNLEPCCHYGKTPPCSKLILDMGIPKVVVAATDPFPKVNGGGIEILRNNSVEVTVGILEKEAREINRLFYTFHLKKRPYIILKWAESIDGYIDTDWDISNIPAKITEQTSQALVHRWRTQVQSIMVGTNTILRDNPKLTARNWIGNNPIRIVIDRNTRIPQNSHIFNNDAPTLIFVSKKTGRNYGDHITEIEFNADIEETILKELYNRKIQSVFIEGGAQLINSFLSKGLWDEARVFIGNIFMEKGIRAPAKPTIQANSLSIIGNDRLFVFRKNNM